MMREYFTLSPNLIRMMRFIDTHDVTVDHLQKANQSTMAALMNRGYIRTIGKPGPNQMVILSQEGKEKLKTFNENKMIERIEFKALSGRVVELLAMIRRRNRRKT